MIRVGQGYDVHRFQDNGGVILGGVKIDYEKGLAAHSDGDQGQNTKSGEEK